MISTHTPDPLPLEVLVDEQCGIIRRVRPVLTPPEAPSAYCSMTAEVSDARWLGDWPADRVSLGTTFGDPRQSWIAAVAEGMERYCGNYLPADIPDTQHFVGSAAEAQQAGYQVVPLEQLPRFAPWQLQRENFEYQDFNEQTPALWTNCRRASDGREILLPASLVYLNWRQQRFAHLPRIHHLNYAGIATGQGFADARDRALLEVIERDALELWWHLDGPTRGIRPESVPGLAESMGDCRLDYWIVQMPGEFAPAMAALVHDPSTGLYAAGFSCKNDPAEAARKAVLEAVHTWIYTQGVTDPDGWVFQAVETGLMARGLYLEHREDRNYLQDTGAGFSRVRDLGAHVQVWLDPQTHHLARRFTEPTLGMVDVSTIPSVPMDQIHRRLANAGHEIYTRDLTTRDVAQTPLRVVRVVVGGLVPNAPAAFSYLGCPRFASAALERGWRRQPPRGPGDFTLIPPPHM